MNQEIIPIICKTETQYMMSRWRAVEHSHLDERKWSVYVMTINGDRTDTAVTSLTDGIMFRRVRNIRDIMAIKKY